MRGNEIGGEKDKESDQESIQECPVERHVKIDFLLFYFIRFLVNSIKFNRSIF